MRTTWDDVRRPGIASDFFQRQAARPFDPAAPGFHAGNAWWLSEISRIVYRRDVQEQSNPLQPERSQFLAQHGLRTLHFVAAPEVGAQAMVVQSMQPGYTVLAFRGTEQKVNDYLTDANLGFESLSSSKIGVHRGFKRALDAIWPELDACLRTLHAPIFYTGHSLGAALATLAAMRRPPNGVYTFGSPRVGNALFAQAAASLPIWRVVHGVDVITTMPPEILGYRHVGALHHLPRAQPAHTPPWHERLMQLTDPPPPLADHAPLHYTDRVAELTRA